MNQATTLDQPTASRSTKTLGVVSFLNALPLRDALGGVDGLKLQLAVPSALLQMLLNGQCEAALLPVIDYWRHRHELAPISDACIASDGETLTVRVFSKTPADRITHLHVDGDSHTSIVLARLLWLELYERPLELIPWEESRSDSDWNAVESILLIGDKVVRRAPRGFGFEVDLGAAWKHLTGLPFVFAAWYGRLGADHSGLIRELERARDAGVFDARRIASEAAASHGWPVETAVQYLCQIMKYRLTDGMRAGMQRFFELVELHGLAT